MRYCVILQIVIALCAHEANAGPWVKAAAKAGVTVRWWQARMHPKHC